MIERSQRYRELMAHSESAYLLAFRLLGNQADAEDAVQEAYLRALRFENQIPAGNGQRVWFLRVMANAAKTLRSSERSRAARERSRAMQTAVEPVTNQSELQLKEAVARALEKLDENQRATLTLHYEQGLSYAEAAEVLQMPEGTLRVYASRGLEALRERLAGMGHAVAPAVAISVLSGGLGITMSPAFAASLNALPVNSAVVTAAAVTKPAIMSAASAKVLIAFAALCAVFGLTRLLKQTVPDGPNQAGGPVVNTGEEKTPSAVPAQPTELEKVLAKRMDVDYRRDRLSEVLKHLEKFTGLKSAYPSALDYEFLFSFAKKDAAVREVVEELAKVGGLKLELKPDVAVFWKAADDAKINELSERLKTGDMQARCEAAHDLSRLSDPRIFPLLFKALKDPEPAVVKWTLEGLLRNKEAIQTAPGLDEFVAWLKAAPVRAYPISGQYFQLMGATLKAELAETIERWMDEKNSAAVYGAIHALGHLRAFDRVARFLKHPDEGLRISAAAMLDAPVPAARMLREKFIAEAGISAITGLLYKGKLAIDPAFAEAVQKRAEQLGIDWRKFNVTGGDERTPPVAELLTKLSSEGWDRYQAIHIIRTNLVRAPEITKRIYDDRLFDLYGKIREPNAVEKLKALISNYQQNDLAEKIFISRSIIDALGKLRDSRANEELVRMLKDPVYKEYFTWLILSLLESPDARAWQIFEEHFIKNPDHLVQFTGWQGLLDRPLPDKFRDALLLSAESGAVTSRRRAMMGMGEMKDPRAVPIALKALNDTDQSIRSSAFSNLSSIADPRTAQPLVDALEKRPYGYGSGLSFIMNSPLFKQYPEIFRPMLVRSLKIEGSSQKPQVILALIQLGDPLGFDGMIEQLQVGSSEIRSLTYNWLRVYRNSVPDEKKESVSQALEEFEKVKADVEKEQQAALQRRKVGREQKEQAATPPEKPDDGDF